MNNLDFLWRLNEYINSMNLYATSYVGNLSVDNSISVLALPGGVTQSFFDGTRDQDYNIQISTKSKRQQECIEALNLIMSNFINLTVLNSTNGSYQFNRFVTDNPPAFVTQLETGEFIYQLSVTAKLTIFRGAI